MDDKMSFYFSAAKVDIILQYKLRAYPYFIEIFLQNVLFKLINTSKTDGLYYVCLKLAIKLLDSGDLKRDPVLLRYGEHWILCNK